MIEGGNERGRDRERKERKLQRKTSERKKYLLLSIIHDCFTCSVYINVMVIIPSKLQFSDAHSDSVVPLELEQY